MSAPTRVYFDVENTLRVPFISGIQRVVRELSRRLIGNSASGFEFIPVVYCSHCQGWRKLSVDEAEQLQELNIGDAGIADTYPYNRKLATKLLGKRVKAKLRKMNNRFSHPAWHRDCLLPKVEPGSIFLDIDASWHNELKRSTMLPSLKESGIFVVVFHYDITPILFPELTHEHTYPLFIEHLHAHLQDCDLFICISRNSEKDVLSYCHQQLPAKNLNTTTIKLGADIACDPKENDSWPLPTKNLKYILSVGTIQPWKNYDLMLVAFDSLSGKYPGINLVIVAREGWHSEKTVARIQQHKLLGKLLFWLININDKTLSNLYINAYLTIISSYNEGFGLPITEALKHGCVTLSSVRGALTEMGGDCVDYFNPENLHEFTDLLESYLSSQELENHKSLLENYHAPSWSNSVSELLEILLDNYSDRIGQSDA